MMKKAAIYSIVAIAAVAGCIVGIVVSTTKKTVKDKEDASQLMLDASDEDQVLIAETLEAQKEVEQLLSQTDLDSLQYYDIDIGETDVDDPISEEEELEALDVSQRRQTNEQNFLKPLACNAGISLDALPCTTFSSLLPSTQKLIIPCGTCVEVDITDGRTVELPMGLLISGILKFPPAANVVIRTTFVFVDGKLQIATPQAGKQVKFTLYGLDDVTYTSPDPGSRCENGCGFGFKPIAVVGGQLDIKGYPEECPSWEKLLRVNPVALNTVYGSAKAADCWGPGTKIVFTSHTRANTGYQVATVVSTDPASGTIVLDRNINKPITLADHPEFAVEIASLSRPVVFEGAADGLFGGHLMIFETQTSQRIEGIEIRNFGQQGLLGRYPLHFHKCSDTPDSIVRKNVIHESFQRGYVIHGSNQITFENNVAFDIVGHCYFLEDSTEEGNTFNRNLGIHVKVMPANSVALLKANPAAGHTSDDKAAVFWISNPRNSFLNNVAAGSERFGFWFECLGDTNKMTVTSFVNNEIHSCLSFGLTVYEPGWRPEQTAYFHNLKVYRNNGDGVFLHVTENIVFQGGIFADAGQKLIFTSRGDSILFEDTKFIGFSGFAEPYVLCRYGAENITGVLIDGTKLNEFDYAGNYVGTVLHNVEFSGFGHETTSVGLCGAGSAPFRVSTHQAFYPAFYNPQFLDNVKIIGDVRPGQACEALKYGIDTTAIEVVEDDYGAISSLASPGFLVSTKLAAYVGECNTYSDCLVFCPDKCLRIVRFLTNGATEVKEMIVTNSDGVEMRIGRDLRNNVTDNANFHAVFVVPLLPGSNLITFVDSNEDETFPEFVVPVFEAEPECTDFATLDDIIIVKPSPSRDVCDDLIINGNFDKNLTGWQNLFSPFVWMPSSGVNQSGALATTTRSWVGGHYPLQYVDMSCIEAGNVYLLNLDYLNSDFAAPCKSDSLSCPAIEIAFKNFDAVTGKFVNALPNRKFSTTKPSPSGYTFSRIEATWSPSEEETSVDQVQFYITGGSGNIIIDNVAMKRAWGNNAIRNGGLDVHEPPSTHPWNGFGNSIALRQPGYFGDKDYALACTRTTNYQEGAYQNIYNRATSNDPAFIARGDVWRIRFKTRLLDRVTGAGINCQPSLGDNNCPMLWVHTISGVDIPTGTQLVDMVHDKKMTWDPNKWNTFDTTITISEQQSVEDLIFFRIIFNGGPVGALLLLDEVSVSKKVRKIPSRLDACGANHVANGDFATTTLGGTWYGWGNPIAATPNGFKGANDYALAATGRTWWGSGMWQNIFSAWKDPEYLTLCVKPGDVYRITFKTRLINPTTQAGVACNPSLKDVNCPLVMINTMRGTTGKIAYVYDTAMVWNPNDWNTFNTTFTVTDEMAGNDLVFFRLIFSGGPAGITLLNDEFLVVMESAS